jgi:GT2 family glycosyltransferase
MFAHTEKSCWTIIVHYNGAEWIEQCLKSFNGTKHEDKIIVIDNCSTEKDEFQKVKKAFPKVTFVILDKNIGFGRANNVGIGIAVEKQADYVFLLNQDAWLCNKNTIENLIEAAENHPQFGIISPIHYNSSKTALDQGFATYLASSKNYHLLSDILFNQQKGIYEVPFVNAAAWLVKTTLIKKIGYFDPDFFMYGEDTDFINRLSYHQFKLGIEINTGICHAREYRVNQYPKTHLTNSEKYQYYGRYLSILKNINYGKVKSITLLSLESGRKISAELHEKNWNRAFQVMKIIFKLLFKLPNILIKRRKYKMLKNN